MMVARFGWHHDVSSYIQRHTQAQGKPNPPPSSLTSPSPSAWRSLGLQAARFH
ncbi:hypothetical protein BO83DRAFT_378361 [Aspergillus eucalypticola CBS 122712]|uniref:Uncharacterized protein n=1 Tax=Aspergillus eucalypticola (strain CBS 122712 / IBT 29274) TaxID=1448314 RepID=A0A317VFX4_ASPEC|nr:uncharacterized protein BO83DRAFT_378361 [Aspergillus eucalypticola CBS 122712]PWY73283.1 hypothetical protein BO83DRAFT_378361 [Aspergillus eucalypticola CBS 122712]